MDVVSRCRSGRREEFLEALRRDFSLIPGMNVIIGQPISHRIDHMLSGTRANIAVKIFGDDLYQLRLLGRAGAARHGRGAGRGRPVHRTADRRAHPARRTSTATPSPATA